MGAYTALHVGINAPAALHFGRRGRLRLGLDAGRQAARGDEGARRRNRQDVCRGRASRRRRRNMPTRRCARPRSTRIRAATPNSRACWPSIRLKATRRPCSISSSSGRRCGRWKSALKKFSVPLLIIVGDEDEPCIDGSVFLKRIGADRRAAGDTAHRPQRSYGGAGGIQRSARRLVCRGRSRPLARAQTVTNKNREHCDGPQAQGQDRAGHRRQRRHRQGHRARARQRGRRRRDLRAPQGAARGDGEGNRQGDRPQDRRHPGRPAPGRGRQKFHRARRTRRSAASTSWSTTPAPPPAA